MTDYPIIIMSSMLFVGEIFGLIVMEYIKRKTEEYQAGLESAASEGTEELAGYLRKRFSKDIKMKESVGDEEIIDVAYFRLWKANKKLGQGLESPNRIQRQFAKEVMVVFLSLLLIGIIGFFVVGIIYQDADMIVGTCILSIDFVLFVAFFRKQRPISEANEASLGILSEVIQARGAVASPRSYG